MEIEQWFNETFWPLYPSDLSHGKKGPKTVALKAMLKLNPSEDMMQDIINKMRVLIRAAKTEKRCGKEPDRWPFASTFINQERWTAIEDMKMPSTVTDKRKCSCGNDLAVGDLCNTCWDKNHPETASFSKSYLYNEGLVKNGLGKRKDETKEEWIQRCKEFSIPRLARLKRMDASGQKDGMEQVHSR